MTDPEVLRAVDEVVAQADPRPVLVDVGASAEAPRVWMPFARHAVFVGFDPDLREMRETNAGLFHRSVVLNEAVAAGADGGKVRVYLTRAPQCSSTLRPDPEVVANYLRAERFAIEREVEAAATTLEGALARLSIPAVDWLKVDTQGTDLRVFHTLGEAARSRLLAVDAEPGLRGMYAGEDLFGDVHRDLMARGFWMSDATVKGRPRVREATMAALAARGTAVAPDVALRGIRSSPGWVECRFLRTIESLERAPHLFGRREYALLWAFALCDDQTGFAADVAAACAARFGADAEARLMLDTALCSIRADCAARRDRPRPGGRIRRRIGGLVRRLWPAQPAAAQA